MRTKLGTLAGEAISDFNFAYVPGALAEREGSDGTTRDSRRGQRERSNRAAGLNTLTGIDVLVRDKFAPLKGLRVALITNHTGPRSRSKSDDRPPQERAGRKLKALFSPEHGIRGVTDEKIGDSVDEKTGLPVYSLYGEHREADRRAVEGPRRARLRHPGRWLSLLYLHLHAGLTLEAAGERKEILCARPCLIRSRVTCEGPVRTGRVVSSPSTLCLCNMV